MNGKQFQFKDLTVRLCPPVLWAADSLILALTFVHTEAGLLLHVLPCQCWQMSPYYEYNMVPYTLHSSTKEFFPCLLCSPVFVLIWVLSNIPYNSLRYSVYSSVSLCPKCPTHNLKKKTSILAYNFIVSLHCSWKCIVESLVRGGGDMEGTVHMVAAGEQRAQPRARGKHGIHSPAPSDVPLCLEALTWRSRV